MVDSGCNVTTIPRAVVDTRGYTIDPLDRPSTITWANGSSETIQSKTSIGPIPAIVSNQAQTSLIAPIDLINKNHKIILDRELSYIQNKSTGKITLLKSCNGLWSLPLEQLETLLHPTTSPNTPDSIVNQPLNLQYTSYSSQYSNTGSLSSITSPRERVWDLHRRVGHCSCEAMCAAISGDNPTWLNSGLIPEQIRRVFRKERCLDCLLAKRNIEGPSTQEHTQRYEPGECISADPSGTISPVGPNGETIFFLFKDVATGHLHAVLSTNKDSDSFLKALKLVIKFYKRHKCKPRILRTDFENNLRSAAVDDFLADMQMVAQSSAPYRHFQNSVERDMQTVIKGTSTLLHAQTFLRSDRWTDALLHYIDIRNRTPNINTANISPHHIITGEATDLHRILQFSFGDIVTFAIPKEQRFWKFDVRNDIAIYIGQAAGSVNTHKLYRPYYHDTIIRGSVYKIEITDTQFRRWYGKRIHMRESSLPFNIVQDAFINFSNPIDEISSPSSTPTVQLAPITDKIPPSDRVLRSHTTANSTTVNDVQSACESSSSDSVPSSFYCYAGKAIRTDDNPTVKTALKSEHREQWITAIRAEVLTSLIGGGTLQPISQSEIDTLPQYQRIFTTMQLKRKLRGSDGKLDKFKARCCARGDLLQGIITETYSPTVNQLTFNTVHQLAIMDNMVRRTVDVVGAYLYQDYPEDALPLIVTLEPAIAEACNLDPAQQYRIRKYLYGLPDAGRAYYQAYSKHLTTHGYLRSVADPCLFFKITSQMRTYIVIHVDDTFVASTTQGGIDEFESILKLQFEITSNHAADSYLGIHLETLSNGSVKLTQPKLLQQLFSEYPPTLTSSKVKVPMLLSSRTPTHNHTASVLIPIHTYLHLLGALLYLTRSRPDIMTAVSYASTRAASPTSEDYQRLLHIISYLRNTKDYGLVLMCGRTRPLHLTCYVDASYLSHPDSKSHSGYYLTFGTIGSFHVKSFKQPLIATSSTHAEAKALYSLTLDIQYVLHICNDLKYSIQLPVTIYEDNNALIHLSTDDATIRKSKHFLMNLHYIRELIDHGIISLHHIDTYLNPADALSKPVDGVSFKYKTQQFMGLAPDDIILPPPAPRRPSPAR